ncbi:cyclic nucleotide-binding domain-containing protein [Nocardioides sp. WS12]|uniref:cyclic nucleotide-binding domain-containing protein n=1 Tax=Nocardioides sp. WS12 TaxID=2486272 RepID=UPI0015F95D6D|nr:cyclic nucleotide-binding domain-containing protein [Nocardioides sp. WS12]
MVNRGMSTGGPPPRGNVKQEMRDLGSVPSFADAPAATLKAMVQAGYIFRVRPRWTLLAERTAPERAYILLDGLADVRRAGDDLGPCRPGDILGEIGILQHRLRSATVVAKDTVRVLHLSREVFEKLNDEHPYFRDVVGEGMLRKLR